MTNTGFLNGSLLLDHFAFGFASGRMTVPLPDGQTFRVEALDEDDDLLRGRALEMVQRVGEEAYLKVKDTARAQTGGRSWTVFQPGTLASGKGKDAFGLGDGWTIASLARSASKPPAFHLVLQGRLRILQFSHPPAAIALTQRFPSIDGFDEVSQHVYPAGNPDGKARYRFDLCAEGLRRLFGLEDTVLPDLSLRMGGLFVPAADEDAFLPFALPSPWYVADTEIARDLSRFGTRTRIRYTARRKDATAPSRDIVLTVFPHISHSPRQHERIEVVLAGEFPFGIKTRLLTRLLGNRKTAQLGDF